MINIKNPIFFWILAIFSFINVLDIATAFFILPGESNPIYIFSGSIFGLIIAKIIILSVLWYYYKRNIYSSNYMYYTLLTMSVLAIFFMCIGVYSNISGIINPEYVETAKNLSSEVKTQAYITFALFFYIIPYSISFLSFWLYEKSRKKIKLNKNFYKLRSWWKL